MKKRSRLVGIQYRYRQEPLVVWDHNMYEVSLDDMSSIKTVDDLMLSIEQGHVALVLCQICHETIAAVNLDTLDVPLTGDSFMSYDTLHSVLNPFIGMTSFLDMKCPVCRFRFADEEAAILTDNGFIATSFEARMGFKKAQEEAAMPVIEDEPLSDTDDTVEVTEDVEEEPAEESKEDPPVKKTRIRKVLDMAKKQKKGKKTKPVEVKKGKKK